MKESDIRKEFERIKGEYGNWTAHNIMLTDEIYTLSREYDCRAKRRAQLYYDIINNYISKNWVRRKKILDLGCLEGGIAIHLAKKGYNVTGLDIRESNIRKAEFASQCLQLTKKCKWITGDVNDTQIWDSMEEFDIVICSGLLYHIEAQNIIPLMKRMKKACKQNGLAIIDTNIAAEGVDIIEAGGLSMFGHYWKEHDENDSLEDRLTKTWSSLHNTQAFWLTERSLVNCLVHSGFRFVSKPLFPYHEWSHQTRDVWVARHGRLDNNKLYKYRDEPDRRPRNHPQLK